MRTAFSICLALSAVATVGRAVADEPRALTTPESLELPPRDAAEDDAKSVTGPLTTLGPLSAVLAASAGVLVSLKLWQKYGGATSGRTPAAAAEVVGRVAVGPRQNVVLLRVGRRVLVVAQADGTLSTLSEIAEPDEVVELLGGLGHPLADTPRPQARDEGFGNRLRAAVDEEPPRPLRPTTTSRSAEQVLADRLRAVGTGPGEGGRRVA